MLERGRSFEVELEALAQRLESALSRIEELWARSTAQDRLAQEAMYFALERAGWTLLEMAKTCAYELRLGIPKRETDALELMRQADLLDLVQGRRFKQLCEYRSLSSRDPERIEPTILASNLSEDLTLFREWLTIARQIPGRAQGRNSTS